MDGKVVAVTGCTSGTGFVCAQACAELGAQVVMLNRKSERADQALQKLREAVPYPAATSVDCNLMSFASVRAAVEQLRSELAATGIDVLCNNAGVCALADGATEDGCDKQMQTNHLSHFLLTAELWPLLEKAAELHGEARVVNHSSAARIGPLDRKYLEKSGGKLGGDDFQGDDTNDPKNGRWHRYHQSKLANVAFTYALRDRVAKAGAKIKSLVAHPGVSKTSMGLNVVESGGATLDWGKAMAQHAQSMQDGTMGILRGCCDEDAQNGDFYGPQMWYNSVGPANLIDEESAADEATRDMLWEVSAEVTGGKFPF